MVDAGQAGPLTGFRPVKQSRQTEVAAVAGVEQVSGFLKTNTTLDLDGTIDVNVFGVEPDGLGWPELTDGDVPTGTSPCLIPLPTIRSRSSPRPSSVTRIITRSPS